MHAAFAAYAALLGLSWIFRVPDAAGGTGYDTEFPARERRADFDICVGEHELMTPLPVSTTQR